MAANNKSNNKPCADCGSIGCMAMSQRDCIGCANHKRRPSNMAASEQLKFKTVRQVNESILRKDSLLWMTPKDCKHLLKPMAFETLRPQKDLEAFNHELKMRCSAPNRKKLKRAIAGELDLLVELYWLGDHHAPEHLRSMFEYLRPYIDRDKTTAATVLELSRKIE